jgi:hypothetical protein
MEWLRFSGLAIGSLPTGILMGVLTIFLLTVKRKSLDTWMLIGYLGVLTVLVLSYVVRYAVLSTFSLNTGQASNLIVFGIVSYLLFAYLFQENYHPRESKIATPLFAAAALYVYIMNFLHYPVLEKAYDFQAHYYTYVFGLPVSLVTGTGYLWIIVVFFRKTVRASGYDGSLDTDRAAARLLRGLVKMVRPRGKRAKSFQALALLTLGMFSISFMYLLMSGGVIGRQAYGLFFNVVGLITTFSLFIVYTNSTFEPSSFRWKLIGVSLAPAMLFLGTLSSIILSLEDASFDNERVLEAEYLRFMLRNNEELMVPDHVVYIVSRSERNFPAGYPVIEYSRSEEIRGSQLVDRGTRNPPELERRFRYLDLEDPGTFFIHYDFSYDNRWYEVGYSYRWYREEIHRVGVKLFYIIMGTMVIILVLFPVFFYRNLFRIDLKIF